MATYRLLIHGARQIVQVVNNGDTVVVGRNMRNVAVCSPQGSDTGCSIIVTSDGTIAGVGTDSDIKEQFKGATFQNTLDASGKCIIPGFVDGHTHAVWAGDRVHEFAMKLAGATYLDVHKAGGGIHFTVRHVHQASEEELFYNLKKYIRQMLEAGTTLAEMKSGYGLETEAEVKMLRVIERARQQLPLEISSTYCGAHAVPIGKTSEEATEDVLTNQLPRVKALMDARELFVDNVDVFCEQGIFSVDQTRRILQAGKDMGLALNFHGEEIHRLHAAEMGAELGARAISHLEQVSEEGMVAMAKAGTVAVVLPTTAYILRLHPPPVREMIDKQVPVALGSDFNPNAPCLAMPVVIHLACVNFKMSMEEALVAATINAAASLGRGSTHGSLEVGKQADMVVLDAPRWEHLIYQFGSYHHIITHVIKAGNIIYKKNT